MKKTKQNCYSLFRNAPTSICPSQVYIGQVLFFRALSCMLSQRSQKKRNCLPWLPLFRTLIWLKLDCCQSWDQKKKKSIHLNTECSFTGIFIGSLEYFKSKVGEISEKTTLKQVLQGGQLRKL